MNILNDLLYDVTHSVKINEKYIIKDKNDKPMIFYYLSNAHIGNPTINLGYEVEDGYDIIFEVEIQDLNLMKDYFVKNNISIELLK